MNVAPLPQNVSTVSELLAFWAEQTPDAPALLAVDREPMTYRDLALAVAAQVSELQRLGIAPDERVALLLPTSLHASVALLAAMTAAVALPLNPTASQTELTRAAAGATAIIAGAAEAAMAGRIAASIGARVIAPSISVDRQSNSFGLDHRGEFIAGQASARADETALIFSTSGTTGVASRVPLSQKQMLLSCAAFGRALQLSASDCCLNPGQLFHVLHVANLLPMLQVGGSTAIVPGGRPAAIISALRRFPISLTITVPALYRAVLDEAAPLVEPIRAPWLRFVVSAGAPLAEDLATSLEAMLGAPVCNLYGLTEAQYIALSPPGQRAPVALGTSLCGALHIVDGSGRSLPTGMVGEIVTRGPHVFSGYLDDADATAAAFLPGGWFRTGDLGYLDAKGVLFLTGRVKEMINRGGEKIAPGEVDAVLLSHPAVAEAAAFAVPDPRLGEEVAAAVVLRDGAIATERDLRRWAAARLSPYKIPRRIWFVDQLPRTGSGKAQRGVLAERFRNVGSG